MSFIKKDIIKKEHEEYFELISQENEIKEIFKKYLEKEKNEQLFKFQEQLKEIHLYLISDKIIESSLKKTLQLIVISNTSEMKIHKTNIKKQVLLINNIKKELNENYLLDDENIDLEGLKNKILEFLDIIKENLYKEQFQSFMKSKDFQKFTKNDGKRNSANLDDGNLLSVKRAPKKTKSTNFIFAKTDSKKIEKNETKTEKIFGISLKKLSKPIPDIIEAIMVHIENNYLEIVGLFRTPGNKKYIKLMTEIINNGETSFEKVIGVCESGKPHALCGLLKLFIRELPESFIPDNVLFEFLTYMEKNMLKADDVNNILTKLPSENYIVLKRFISLFVKIDNKKDSNLMNTENLGII
jgi:hypothetical protein